MDNRSIIDKYWVEFDEDGDIKSLYKSKYECKNECKEYIVKLIPIERDVSKEIVESMDKVANEIKQSTKRLDNEFKKVLKDVKGVLK